MAKLVFANEDLKRHIFSFGDPTHREFTDSLAEILKVDCDSFKERYQEWYWSTNQRPMRFYLREEFTVEERLYWMHYFNRCKCCTRHSHYKPFGDANCVTIVSCSSTNRECSCPCRHFARHCARSIIG